MAWPASLVIGATRQHRNSPTTALERAIEIMHDPDAALVRANAELEEWQSRRRTTGDTEPKP